MQAIKSDQRLLCLVPSSKFILNVTWSTNLLVTPVFYRVTIIGQPKKCSDGYYPRCVRLVMAEKIIGNGTTTTVASEYCITNSKKAYNYAPIRCIFCCTVVHALPWHTVDGKDTFE